MLENLQYVKQLRLILKPQKKLQPSKLESDGTSRIYRVDAVIYTKHLFLVV